MPASRRTMLGDLHELRYPILKAEMGGTHTPGLAAAVSAAGGLGLIGAIMLDGMSHGRVR